MNVARSPLRVSLVGGGSDLPSFYEKHGTGSVCSFAINKYVYVMAKNLPDVFPYRYKLGYSTTELCNSASEIRHPIIRAAVERYNIKSLDLASMADIPAGTGLGSSSAFTCALVKALNPNARNRWVAEEACAIELEMLKEPIGKQDQYASAFGGVNILSFYKSLTSVDVSPIDIDRVPGVLLRVDGERSASHSLRNSSPASPTIAALSFGCAAALEQETYDEVGKLINCGWALKAESMAVTEKNYRIKSLVSKAQMLCHGAKLLGAGDSGFIFCLAPDQEHEFIAEQMGLKPVSYEIDWEGTKIL